MPGLTSPTTPLRIVLAEDVALLREGLVGILERSGHEVVAAVEDAEALLAFTARHQPDLVVTDIRMPPTHTDEGLRAAAQIRVEHPRIAIMVLSAYVAEAYVPELLDATSSTGGSAGVGYLLKDRVGHVREFLDSLDRVASGETVVDPQVVRQLLGRRRDDGPLATLTEREREVLAPDIGLQGLGVGDGGEDLVTGTFEDADEPLTEEGGVLGEHDP